MEYQTEAVDVLAHQGLEVGEKKSSSKSSKAGAKPKAVEAQAPQANVFDIVGELKTVLDERKKLREETAKLKGWLKEVEALEKQLRDVLNRGGSLIKG